MSVRKAYKTSIENKYILIYIIIYHQKSLQENFQMAVRRAYKVCPKNKYILTKAYFFPVTGKHQRNFYQNPSKELFRCL